MAGGAGYIGSHTALELLRGGHDVVVVDDFSNSSPAALDRIAELAGRPVEAHEFDLCDAPAVRALFARSEFDAVMHFAGKKAVGESVAQPIAYYRTNVDSTLALLEAMQATGVRRLIFSSSATVYGPDATAPLAEELPLSASNPYGWTKVVIERILQDLAAADGTFRIGLLRYFNPVGADPSGLIGENPRGRPNNLMPLLLQAASGELPLLQVYGDDYDTADGTGVRDYLHVSDIAAGHVAALTALDRIGTPIRAWNLGTGRGTSVLQLVRAFEAATGQRVPYEIVARRPGDVAECYADPARAERELGWRATRSLAEMCADAWRWKVNGRMDA